ncbi:MAG: flavin reductase [Planctomycetota bacterium]|nr:flavin reductase [Planctomycetota bacterium]MDA1262142.1 flavin reductase [Planctomycetota bacterium]
MQTDRPAADRLTVEHVLNLVPATSFLLTSAYGELRSGVIVRCVQQVAMHPPMLLVAMEKGQPLSPIIRDSRNFAICVLAKDDRVTTKTFATSPDQGIDAFLTIPNLVVPGGSPVPLRALGYIACELIRHLDIEADYEVYIGMVHHAGLVDQPKLKLPRSGVMRAHLKTRKRIFKKSAASPKPSDSTRQRTLSKSRRPSER